MERRPFGFALLFLLLAVRLAHAQVASLGKGWLLDSGGSITSAPGEVISGRNSIKASGTSPAGFATSFLETDPTFVRFSRNQSYTIAFSYRIITADGAGFGYAFESSEAGLELGLDAVLRGASGSSGTVTTTFRLNNHGDYRVRVSIDGRGSIVIDDVRITDASGQLVASENAEGPTLATGPLNFQLTDAMALLTEAGASVRSAAVKDLNGDGYPETILTLTAPQPSTTAFPPVIIEANGRMRLATADFFPSGAPTVKHSPVTLFADINGDGLQDILFADAGSDCVCPGSKIGVALNLGGGKYRDVSSLIPADLQTTDSYTLAAGDIDGDGRVEIILPDSQNGRGLNTALLRWNGTGFDAQRNWIAPTLWRDPTSLSYQSGLVIADLDNDGRQDLLVTGLDNEPNVRILFGAAGGYTSAGLLQLPDGLFGHAPWSSLENTQGANVEPVVVADFNNDGLPDIFATEERVNHYLPGTITDTNEPDYVTILANGGTVFAEMGLQVFINAGSRRFVDVTSASTAQNLGRRHYESLIPIDLNNDGFLDVVGLYATKSYGGVVGGQWGTTWFLNDGTGAFQVVDGARFLAVTTTPTNGQQWSLGSFVPTVVNPHRTEGIVFESVGGGSARGLNLYKAVANGSIGTGPDFADSASLGAPGFNEFYYLRHYADAAAAVQRGEYSSGLAHYLAVGRSKGYAAHAPDLRLSDDLVADFGTTLGVWLRDGNTGAWGRLHTATARNIVTGDLDGNGISEVIIDFGPSGTWVWANNSGWFQLHQSTTTRMATGDLDGNGKAEVLIDFPGYGIWVWSNNTSWFQLHSSGSSNIVVADLDGNGKKEAIIDFPGSGLWVWSNNTSWNQLHSLNSRLMTAGDFDGNGKVDLVIDFSGYGLWSYSNNSSWAPVHPLNSSHLAAGDVDGNGQSDLIIDFGNPFGIWMLLNGTAWSQLHTLTSTNIVTTDLDRNGKAKVIINFGAAGLWGYVNTTWIQLHSVSPGAIAVGHIDAP